jgi:hypothetical protein
MVIAPPGLADAAAPPEGVTLAEVELVAEDVVEELEELDPHPAANAATATAATATPLNRATREPAAKVGVMWLIDSSAPWLGVGGGLKLG